MKTAVCFPLVLGSLLAAIPASAQSPDIVKTPNSGGDSPGLDRPSEESETPGVAFRIVAHTDFPVFAGVGIDLEVPGRLRLASSAGVLPGSYVEASNGVLVPLLEGDGYARERAELVQSMLENSFVWRTSLGWRPFRSHGFILGGGYTYANLGGAATAAEIVEGVTGAPLPTEVDGQFDVEVGSTVHFVHAELGWAWNLGDHVWLRSGIGWSFAVASSTTVDVDFPKELDALNAFEGEAGSYLDGLITNFVHPAHVTLALGWDI